MTSKLEQDINSLWRSEDFRSSYSHMSEPRQYALDSIKEAIIGEIEPRTTVNRIDTLVETLSGVGSELSGTVRTYAAKMIDAYANRVSRTGFKRRHPTRYKTLIGLSQKLGALYLKALKQDISLLKKGKRELEKQNSQILRGSERADRLCNSAFVCYDSDPDKAKALYEKALAVEPIELRKAVIHGNIGSLLFNQAQYQAALAELELAHKTKEIRGLMRTCMAYIRQAAQPEAAGVAIPLIQQPAAPAPAAVVPPPAAPAPRRAQRNRPRRDAAPAPAAVVPPPAAPADAHAALPQAPVAPQPPADVPPAGPNAAPPQAAPGAPAAAARPPRQRRLRMDV